jgi:transmembrane sensor
MNTGSHSDRTAGLSEEAAHWFVRLKDDDMGSVERRQYLAWLRQGPANVAEMLRICSVYGVARDAGLTDNITFDDREPNVLPWPRPGLAGPLSRRMAAVWAVVALGATLAAALAFLDGGETIETGYSEWRHVTLDDGSVLRIGPHTRLRVTLKDSHRSIEMKAGEATFQVAQDVTRPFVVDAGVAKVRVLGTLFGVQRSSADLLVTVAEGSVAVADTRLETGEQVAVTSAGMSAVRTVDLTRALAWAEGRLVFESETIGQALQEFNRRNRVQIEVRDPHIARLPVRGVFNAADPESFVNVLSTAAGIEVQRENARRWILTQKTGDGFRK